MRYVFFFFFFQCTFYAKAQSFKEINDSLSYYYMTFQYEKSIPFAEKALVYVNEKYGKDNKIYPQYLYLLASMYVGSGTFLKAEPLFVEVVDISKRTKADTTKIYIRSISMLAVIYNTGGEDDKAIPLFTEAAEYYLSLIHI